MPTFFEFWPSFQFSFFLGHIQSVVGASEEVRQEIKKYKDALTLMFNKQEKVLVCFERNYKTRHLQVSLFSAAICNLVLF